MVAQRGRPPTPLALLEEARVQAVALRQELAAHDQWEAAAMSGAAIIRARSRALDPATSKADAQGVLL